MLERLHFVLLGCVDEGTQDSDRVVALNQNRESPKEEGAIAVVICALCDAPSEFAQEVHPVLADFMLINLFIHSLIMVLFTQSSRTCRNHSVRSQLQCGIKSFLRLSLQATQLLHLDCWTPCSGLRLVECSLHLMAEWASRLCPLSMPAVTGMRMTAGCIADRRTSLWCRPTENCNNMNLVCWLIQ